MKKIIKLIALILTAVVFISACGSIPQGQQGTVGPSGNANNTVQENTGSPDTNSAENSAGYVFAILA